MLLDKRQATTPNDTTAVICWAKTTESGAPGVSVRQHCINVGCVAEAVIERMPNVVKRLLPAGAATLAALHDAGKITVGFQAKSPQWLSQAKLPCGIGEVALSISDHALVSQYFLQELPSFGSAKLWAVALGSHHGRPKGRRVRLKMEALAEQFQSLRVALKTELEELFGPLPTKPPNPCFAPYHSDLWLLSGLITFADWIGSNEGWFPPDRGLTLEEAKLRAAQALREIGWPGGKLRQTSFGDAFSAEQARPFSPNSVQEGILRAVEGKPSLVIVEAPMGCGKTEAALFAAQKLIADGHRHGIYFALPTQITSQRIHRRIESFLQRTLADHAPLRLAHGNAWLEDDFSLVIHPAFRNWTQDDGDAPGESVRDARSWFASSKQALLATYGVGTIDQALQAVITVKHFFLRRFALAGKVVILDEVHSYDVYTGSLVAVLIRELIHLECTVIVLSATLTAQRRRELLAIAGISEPEASEEYPLITSGSKGEKALHSAPGWETKKSIQTQAAATEETEVIQELCSRAEQGQHVLWIRNTVVEAQQSYCALKGAAREGAFECGLLHSRFAFEDRAKHEQRWLDRLGRNRLAGGPGTVLIATQVVEQSVDIDLDYIVSDLAPTDMLLQRMGRLWRHPRASRKAAIPEFWIRLPDIAGVSTARGLKKCLGRSGRVYAPYVLLRTMNVWANRVRIMLPEDIRTLLEQTYAEPGSNEPQSWTELHDELEKQKRDLEMLAEPATLVLGRQALEDEEGVLTRLRSAPTVPLLLVKSFTPSRAFSITADSLDDASMEISERDWARGAARFVHRWTVRAPAWMVPKDAPRPGWLALHGHKDAAVATVDADGRCCFDERPSIVRYHGETGLFAERSKPTCSQPEDDDEFDQ